MATRALRNAGGVPFLTLKGHVVVRQRQMPDGDTLSFAASQRYTAKLVKTNVPVDASGETTVNIRLQSIDAPEKSQPFGAQSRDQLLKHFGIKASAFGLTDEDFTADGAIALRPAWLATHAQDGNGRPLGYLFRESVKLTHGAEISAHDLLRVLRRSANYSLASRGWAFPAFYENTDEAHAAVFARAAAKARTAGKGIWAHDVTTSGFVPTKSALGHGGALVYPKFYRRIEDWKSATPSAAAFITWLKKQRDGRKPVQGATVTPIPLWQLFEIVNPSKVAVPYDVTKLWFSE